MNPSRLVALLALAAIATARAAPQEFANVVRLEAGAKHACALSAAGEVRCWGENARGQLGNGTTSGAFVAYPIPQLANGAAAIAVGRGSWDSPDADAHSCAVLAAGTMKCWGANTYGQLGDGTAVDRVSPVDVVGLAAPVVAAAAGAGHTCALLATGGVQCWGHNDSGQLGNGTLLSSAVPIAVSGLGSGIVAITAAAEHSCALGSAGSVQCWGGNSRGQLGDGTRTNRLTPTAVLSLGAGIAAISAGGASVDYDDHVPFIFPGSPYSCALTGSGETLCWGANLMGQLGDGSTQDRPSPTAVATLGGGVRRISTGGFLHNFAPGQYGGLAHSCAVTAAGGAKCWGASLCGALGDGHAASCSSISYFSAVPVDVMGLSTGVETIAAGGNFSCAVIAGGQVRCWGGGYAPQPIPVLAGLFPQFISIGSPPRISVGGSASLTASGGASGNPVTFTSLAPSVCSINGSTVTALATGTCVVAANQAGSALYDAATQVTATMPIGAPVAQTITMSTTSVVGVGQTRLFAPVATSGLPVAVISQTPAICSVSSGTVNVTGIAEGACVLLANQPGDAYWAPAPQKTFSLWIVTVEAATPRLSNLSTRGQVRSGNDVLIAGFVVGGSASKTVVINVAGPSLASLGITDPLQDPTLTLVRSADNAIIATNDNWRSSSQAAAIQASGFAPANDYEPAIIASLPPGAYTAVVQGVRDAGVGLVGVFEVDHPEIPLINIATRGLVLTGNDVMIAGFVIDGSSPKTVVVSVAGPSLASFGVANPLARPELSLVRSSNNQLLAFNGGWTNAFNAAQIQASGFAPANAFEPAIMMTLAPGAYTAIVRGSLGTTGVGLVGVFTVN